MKMNAERIRCGLVSVPRSNDRNFCSARWLGREEALVALPLGRETNYHRADRWKGRAKFKRGGGMKRGKIKEIERKN